MTSPPGGKLPAGEIVIRIVFSGYVGVHDEPWTGHAGTTAAATLPPTLTARVRG